MLGCTDLAVLWRNHVGRVQARDGRWHVFGLAVGSADLVGIRRADGRFVSIEVKSVDGRERPEQNLWRELVRSLGGLAGTARSVDEARGIITGER